MMKLGVVYYKTASAEADALQEYKTPWVFAKESRPIYRMATLFIPALTRAARRCLKF